MTSQEIGEAVNQEEPRSARTPLVVALGAVVVLAAVLAVLLVVNSDEDPAPTEARPRPELAPLVLGERVWAAESVPVVVNWRTGRLREGRLLVGTKDGIQLVDVGSGAVLWAQNDEEDLPRQTVALDVTATPQTPFLVRHGDGVGVLVGYDVFFRCDLVEPGVALLSGENGEVVWRAPTTPAEGCARNQVHWKQQLWAADDTTALVSVAPDFGDPDDVGQVRMLALDVATGQRKWEHQGAWPRAIAGGVAMVSTDKPTRSGFTGPGMVTALDLATGQPKWSLADRYPVAHLAYAAGDVVVVVTNDESGENEVVRVLDAATGNELATLPEADPDFCVADATLVACRADPLAEGLRLVTFQPEDRAVMTVPLEENTVLLSVVQGRISVTNIDRTPSLFTIDRTGNVIDEKPPGELLAMTDDFLLVRTNPGEEDESLAGYRVTGG